MALLRIYCDYCKQKWDVYERSINDEKSRICPHCLSAIDSQIWRKQVVPALSMVADANRELMTDHIRYHRSIFQIDVIEDTYFPARSEE